ncbi:MAG: ABC transporter ATP-binding protein [Planctomycetota bacterium]
MSESHTLRTDKLTLGYDGRTVVEDLNLVVPPGSLTALVGANGSGKSTILKACARLLAPTHGAALLDGASIHAMKSRDVAKRLAILPQDPTAPAALTVSELVSYGRFPYRNALGLTSGEDREAMRAAMEVADLHGFADRPIGQLSGGERQRVWIAMTLAQDTEYLLLDEPTASLDLLHQIEVMDLLVHLNRERGKTIVVVLHDLNLAARYASHMVAIKDGAIRHAGAPAEVMTAERLREVFGIEAEIVHSERDGAPLCVAYRR